MATNPDTNNSKDNGLPAFDVMKTFESVDLMHTNFDAITAQIRDEINTLLQDDEIEFDTVGSVDTYQYFRRNQQRTKAFASIRSDLNNKQIQGAVKHLGDALLVDNAVGTHAKVHEVLSAKIPKIQKIADTFAKKESVIKPTIEHVPQKERWTAKFLKKGKNYWDDKIEAVEKGLKGIKIPYWHWKSALKGAVAIPVGLWGAAKSTVPYIKTGYGWINGFLEYFDWSHDKFWVNDALSDSGQGHKTGNKPYIEKSHPKKAQSESHEKEEAKKNASNDAVDAKIKDHDDKAHTDSQH